MESILKFFKQYIFNQKNIEKYSILKNKRIIVFLILNFILFFGSRFENFFILLFYLLFYLIQIGFSFSNVLEKMLRKFYDIRHIATKTEKERLIPLFHEVYRKALKKDRQLSKDIELYIVDEFSLNAFSLIKNTIVIDRGLMSTMSDSELKAIIAHEIAHLSYKDTQFKALITIITLYYTSTFYLLFFAIRILINILGENILSSILKIFNNILLRIYIFFTNLFQIVLCKNYKKQEYRADFFACELNYKSELLSALYKLYNTQIIDKKDMISRYQTEHPRLAYRIEAIENYNK